MNNTSLLFPNAAQPDIIRANQKDAYYITNLEAQMKEVINLFFGNRFTFTYAKEINLLTDALYFGFTTLLDRPTFGEEYCDIIQLDKNEHNTLNFKKRMALVLFHVGLPYLVSNGINYFKQKLRMLIPKVQNEDIKKYLNVLVNTILPLSTKLIDEYLQPIHLAVFYFFGAYYHLSKRLLNVQYFYPRKLRQGESSAGYEILGLLIALQLAIKGGKSLLQVINNRKSKQNEVKQSVDEQKKVQEEKTNKHIENSVKCTLCLSQCIDTTSTPCGHLFCYTCIGEWGRNKNECPLCRQPISLAQLWPVLNF